MADVAARQQWFVGHPVVGSIAMGLFWGVGGGLLWALVFGTRLGLSLIVWVLAGVLLFGPAFMILLRRKTQGP